MDSAIQRLNNPGLVVQWTIWYLMVKLLSDKEIQVMTGMVICRESDRYLWSVLGVEVRNNVR